MQKFLPCIVFIFLAVFARTGAFASVAPDEFLSELLKDEFGGNAFRVGKVIFTDKKGAIVGDCDCSVPRELFEVEASPIVIVSKWDLLPSPVSSSGSERVIQVQFHVLAKTEGEGVASNSTDGRHVFLLPVPHDERVSYHLRLKKGNWFLVDPPLPRVWIGTVVSQLRNEARDAKKRAERYLSSDKKDKIRREIAQTQYNGFQKQLDVLEPLFEELVRNDALER